VDKVEASEAKDGVRWHLDTGATFNLSDNRSVIGQPDGTTATFGYKSALGVELREGPHEWRNTASTAAGVTYTPVVPDIVKSRDLTEAETIYLFHIIDWFGPFARFALSTSTFSGTDVRAEPTTYSIQRLDGTTDTVITERLRLTRPFRPTRLKESIGVFFQPVASEEVTTELRIGGGARNIFAVNQLALDDDDATPAVDVVELDDVHQVGIEAVYELFGQLLQKGIQYKLVAEVLIPLWHSDLPPGDDRNALELTNFALKATFSARVVEWASVDYELGVVREPQLLDAWQIRNNLLLTFGIATGNVEPPKPKPQ
jgi:hypothetical protein